MSWHQNKTAHRGSSKRATIEIGTETRAHSTPVRHPICTVWQRVYSFSSLYDGRQNVWNRSKHSTICIITLNSQRVRTGGSWAPTVTYGVCVQCTHITTQPHCFVSMLMANANVLAFFLLLFACVIVSVGVAGCMALFFPIFTTETFSRIGSLQLCSTVSNTHRKWKWRKELRSI